jgi:hypothetical protein
MSSRSKIDTTAPLFCAKRQAKEGTVFDTIRKIVGEKTNGVLYQELVDYLTKNWAPEKAETYGPGYIRAYVTGGMKEGYLTQDPTLRVDYSSRPKGGAKALKATSASSPLPSSTSSAPNPPKASQGKVLGLVRHDVLQYMRDKHGFTSFEDSGERGTRIPEIAEGLKTSVDMVETIVKSCAEDKLLTIALDGYIFFTREGFKQTKKIAVPA